jgi:phage/plasmid primase-like uncharacterized protein/KaiC/GvpD/RAD55 family RecA-like ATPase
MVDVTHIFGGPWRLPTAVALEDQVRQAMASAGVTPPATIALDGKLHRYQTGSKGQPGHDKPGWYVFFPDGVPAGMFGDWRTGVSNTWRADIGRELTGEELASVARRQAEARSARDAKAASAADSVDLIWSQAGPASPDHPYLMRKGVGAHGLRITGDGRLMAPLFNTDGTLSSLQYIDADGAKLYHPGGATGGKYWSVGLLEGDLIYIAEGFATAATIHEVTGRPCVVAYSASNLVPVTGAITTTHPSARVVIVADNDASGVGQRYGEQASARHGARLILVPIPGDANDYRAAGHDLAALLNPSVDQWLIPADDFSAQPAPISWLVKGWLQDKALIMVHGPSGGGKTFLVLDWVLTMASGARQWNGRKVRPGPVVYLAGEGHQGLRGRVAAWKQHHGVASLSMWLSKGGCDLNTRDGLRRVSDAVRELPVTPSVIVVDTLHRFLNGDENKAQDAKTMLDACAELMDTFKAAVILVHHTGVSDEAQHRARGSSAWRGALDIEVSVVPQDNGLMQVVQRKSKDAELAEDITVELMSVPITGWLDEDGEQVTSAVVELTDRKPQRKDSAKMHQHQQTFRRAWEHGGSVWRDSLPYVTREAVAEVLGLDGLKDGSIRNALNPNADRKLVNVLMQAGYVTPTPGGWHLIQPEWVAQLRMI